MRILVTGASGFVGGALLRAGCSTTSHDWRAAVRRPIELPATAEQVQFGGLSGAADWSAALRGVDVVVHAAARVHMMRDSATDPLAEFRRVNVAATRALAEQAARHGVRRFVFVSSIKVNGERTDPGRPFTAADEPHPGDGYGVSKREAEDVLSAVAARTGLEITIVRPVLVYGPGVGANFFALIRAIERGIPLPFASVRNRRSFVAVDNLVNLMLVCVTHPAAAGHVFLVSDGEDVSTSELIERIARAMGVRARLFPVPPSLLLAGARLLNRGDMGRRLCESLQVDIGPTRSLLSWSPPLSLDDGLRRLALVMRRDGA